jgi:hypothetical protein
VIAAARRGRRLVPRLSWLELRALCAAQTALLHAQFLLWRRPIGRLIDRVAVGTATASVGVDRAVQISIVATAIDRAARRGLFTPQCLVRALALHLMLERRAIAGSVVRIGVRTDGGELLAHAWVEIDGFTLLDAPALVAAFTPLTDARLAATTPARS